jgi:CHAD domain-containing protein
MFPCFRTNQPGSTTVMALRTYLRKQAAALAGQVEGARRFDVDAVHDMRVAARRLRSTLRTFRPLLDRSRSEPVRAELGWLSGQLGAVRDADVLAGELLAAVHAEPPELLPGPVAARLEQRLSADSAVARAALTGALDSDRMARLLTDVQALVEDAPAVPGRRLRKYTTRALDRADRELAAAFPSTVDRRPSLDTVDDAALHEARKSYKRARYAVELLDTAESRRLARRLTALQDLLGHYQDTVVARGLLRELGLRAQEQGENAFGYGLLHARQAAAADRALDELSRTRRRDTP